MVVGCACCEVHRFKLFVRTNEDLVAFNLDELFIKKDLISHEHDGGMMDRLVEVVSLLCVDIYNGRDACECLCIHATYDAIVELVEVCGKFFIGIGRTRLRREEILVHVLDFLKWSEGCDMCEEALDPGRIGALLDAFARAEFAK